MVILLFFGLWYISPTFNYGNENAAHWDICGYTFPRFFRGMWHISFSMIKWLAVERYNLSRGSIERP